jgi:hypothetical protein
MSVSMNPACRAVTWTPRGLRMARVLLVTDSDAALEAL